MEFKLSIGNLTASVNQLENSLQKLTPLVAQLASIEAESFIKVEEMQRPKKDRYQVVSQGGKLTIKTASRNRLAQSIARGTVNKKSDSIFDITVGSNVKYAPSIIGDTEPYKIRPKKGKFLVFAVGSNPKTDIIFAKEVTHPGGIALTGDSTGKALLSRAAEKIENEADEIIKKTIAFSGLQL